MSSFEFAVLSPTSGGCGVLTRPSLAVSGARAGEMGVVDIESCTQLEALPSTLETMSRVGGGGGFGVRCGLEEFEAIAPATLVAGKGQKQSLLILGGEFSALSGKDVAGYKTRVAAFRKAGIRVAVEIVTFEQASQWEKVGVDIIIAKGHESTGLVGDTTTFVLVQQLVGSVEVPVWVRGGIGIHTIAAAKAAGAQGCVLDAQLYLASDSMVPDAHRELIAKLDGTETVLLPGPGACSYRVLVRPATTDLGWLTEKLEASISAGDLQLWRRTISDLLCGRNIPERSEDAADNFQILSVGQDGAFASHLANRGGTVAGILDLLRESISEHLEDAGRADALNAGSKLADSHGTRFPIVQGAMTRVSDNADFALKVAESGGLPFLALALMRSADIDALLSETSKKLGDLPWGVGILGFVPAQLRSEQMKVIEKHKPPFALIAGGRPDQAVSLETSGITSYLHVPSPRLLETFIEMGSRRFIFEGKECGGHVGPRTSFVLWELMVEKILEMMAPNQDPTSYHVLFAGGIHDAVSSSMVAALAAPLSARGVNVGVLVGSAYLFTEEAVESGAIVKRFQDEAVRCQRTVLLESGPGHAIRCMDSPYLDTFNARKNELQKKERSSEEIKQDLELMNLGRLRMASKGIQRAGSDIEQVDEDRQWSEGMYMIGQISSMRNEVVKMEELHRDIAVGGAERIRQIARQVSPQVEVVAPGGEPVAIVGMSCFLPQANDVETFWRNILNKVDSIEEVPETHWDWRSLYDPNPLAPDKIVSKWGGFLKSVAFDPSRYGIPPSSLSSVDPIQLLVLESVRLALTDAGYKSRKFPRKKTSVILANAGHGPIGAFYALRSLLGWTLENLDEEDKKLIEAATPEWTEDSFPGYLSNVTAGRVANRFDFGGINVCLDAACASSLAAIYMAVNDLRSGASDVVLMGSADTHNQPGDYLSFSKTHALSPGGRCRTFDATANGIVISEGITSLVLKRLADAERDGDRIYAVIKGIGGSSDGRGLSLTAPSREGQMSALRRAYNDAGISPATVGLVEAHGTGTVAGDRAEVGALSTVYSESGAIQGSCAIGSVKTNIGHTKCTAGAASLIKVAKSLYHKVLPPTIGVEVPNPNCGFGSNPFYVNSEARPWISTASYPRRAAISAFGFGGTNFHTVLEEYVPVVAGRGDFATSTFAKELFVFSAGSREHLLKSLSAFKVQVSRMQEKRRSTAETLANSREGAQLLELARTSLRKVRDRGRVPVAMAILAGTLDELKDKLEIAVTMVDVDEKSGSASPERQRHPRGIFFRDRSGLPGDYSPPLAFLFPGQGSQRVNMLGELSLYFPEVREQFEKGDKQTADYLKRPVSSFVYPAPVFTEEEKKAQDAALRNTDIAQPAVGLADLAMLKLLSSFGVTPSMVAGHSYGEYVALHSAGVMSEDDLVKISLERGRILASADSNGGAGGMLAFSAPVEKVEELIRNFDDVTIANLNAPGQCVVAGPEASIEKLRSEAKSASVSCRKVPVSCAFHSPFMARAAEELKKSIAEIEIKEPELDVYSNTTARLYPSKCDDISKLLVQHATRPVRFSEQLENMKAAGAKVFLEVGPGSVLTSLVSSTFSNSDNEIVALSMDHSSKGGIESLLSALAQLWTEGVPVELERLFEGRHIFLDDDSAEATRGKLKLSYMIDSQRITRVGDNKTFAYGRAFQKGASAKSEYRTAAARLSSSDSPVAGVKKTQLTGVSGGNQVLPTARNTQSPQAQSVKSSDGTGNGASISRPTGTAGSSSSNAGRPVPASGDRARTRPIGSTSEKTSEHAEQVILQYQQSMMKMTERFIEAQKQVVLAYLHGGEPGASGVSLEDLAASNGKVETFEPSKPHRNGGSNGSGPRDVAMSIDSSAFQVPAPTLADSNGKHGPSRKGLAEAPAAATARTDDKEVAVEESMPGSAELAEKLLEIISERTGYPAEMIDPKLDLEADLGIDSIKRVEILNSFRKILPATVQESLENNLEELAGTKTLEQIIAWLEKVSSGPGSGGVDSTAPQGRAVTPADAKRVSSDSAVVSPKLPASGQSVARGVVVLKPLPSSGDSTSSRKSATALLVGGPEKLQGALSKHCKKSSISLDWLNLTDCSDRSATLAKLKKSFSALSGKGLPDTVFFSSALDEGSDKPLLLLEVARQLYELCSGNAGYAPRLIVITTLGGRFGLSPVSIHTNGSRNGTSPSKQELSVEELTQQAALAGMTKTVNRELANVEARYVDVSPSLPLPTLAELLLGEAVSSEDLVEVSYDMSSGPVERFTLDIEPRKLVPTSGSATDLSPASLVLVTGGARGITAGITLEMARKYGCNFIVLGRSSLPPASENKLTAGLESQKDIKAALIDSIRSAGQKVELPEVERRYRQLMSEREIRQNLKTLEKHAASVRYFPVDVRDEAKLTEIVNSIYEVFGTIDGVIHGAGVIEDANIGKKTVESFERVYETKVRSALTLIKACRLDALKFFYFFSSVVARTGNAGQIDYVAANETLNKLAQTLNAKTDARVASLMWGPWKGGMAQPELEEIFASYGWAMIDPLAGYECFMNELTESPKQDVEVLLVAELPDAAVRATKISGAQSTGDIPSSGNANVVGSVSTISTGAAPLLIDSSFRSLKPIELSVSIDRTRHLYLEDHKLDGVPVLPMAVAMEMMLESVSTMPGGRAPKVLRDLDIPKGVVISGKKKELIVKVAPSESGADRVTIESPDGKSHFGVTTHYDLKSAPTGSGAPRAGLFSTLIGGYLSKKLDRTALENLEATPPTPVDVYRRWMFHGTLFQGIQEIEAIGSNGIIGRVKGNSTSTCVAGSEELEWVIDPTLFDSSMQLAGIWARYFFDITCLPTGIRRLTVFGDASLREAYVHVSLPQGMKAGELLCDLGIYDLDGNLRILVEGLSGIGSKLFNRFEPVASSKEGA